MLVEVCVWFQRKINHRFSHNWLLDIKRAPEGDFQENSRSPHVITKDVSKMWLSQRCVCIWLRRTHLCMMPYLVSSSNSLCRRHWLRFKQNCYIEQESGKVIVSNKPMDVSYGILRIKLLALW
jgi:hypothetical protein